MHFLILPLWELLKKKQKNKAAGRSGMETNSEKDVNVIDKTSSN